MVNITLALPEDLQRKMKKHSEIKWSEIARIAIEQKISEIEIEEEIASKSKLLKNDVEEISDKINRDAFEEMENEIHS